MAGDVYIGVDAGTSVIKAVAFALDGTQLGLAATPNTYVSGPGGAVEQDMAHTWTETGSVIRQLVDQVPSLDARCAALAITAQGDGTWLIDGAGEPVTPAWLWLDARAAKLVQELRANGTGARIYSLTGSGLNPCQQGAQLVWLAQNRPDVLKRAATAFHCKDWLYFKLTGERVTDLSEGNFTFGNFRTRAYAPEILDALGLGSLGRLLPPMLDGARTTHPLSSAGAAATGLPAGTPVALGGVDVVCTALGGGLFGAGEIGCTVLGSTGMHMRHAAQPADVTLNDAGTGYTMTVAGDGLAQMQSNMSATLNIDWLIGLAMEAAGLLGASATRQDALAQIDARILDARPGAALFHPYIHTAGERGPFVAPDARAQVTGLSDRVGLLDLARAIYEGLAFAARDCYAAMGHQPQEIRLTGGAARSQALRRILASTLKAPVRTCARAEAGAAGVAMMAMVATGAFPDLDAACRAWVDPLLGEPEPPDPDLARHYEALFPIYQSVHQSMHPAWGDLARVRAEFPA